jgi:hypothetical protein
MGEVAASQRLIIDSGQQVSRLNTGTRRGRTGNNGDDNKLTGRNRNDLNPDPADRTLGRRDSGCQ